MSKTKAQLANEVKRMRSALARSKKRVVARPKRARRVRVVKVPRVAGAIPYVASVPAAPPVAALPPSVVESPPKASSGITAEGVGSALGGWVGRKAGDWFGKLFGSGDYTVKSNSLMTGTDPPIVGQASGRATIIRHREYIQDISSSTAFTLQSFPINPGVITTFPWLYCIAQNYEEYVIRGMVFEFKSTSANALNSTNTALGTVIMATNYNVYRPNFISKTEMENHEFCTSAKPSESFMHPIECAVGENPLHVMFVRTDTPGQGDLRMYDLGTFQIATVGSQATAVIGELWVTYDIEFLKPRVTTMTTSYVDHYTLDAASVAAALPYGTAPVKASGSNFGTTISGGDLILPNDSDGYDFLVVYQCTGASTVLTNSLSYASGSAISRNAKWHSTATTQMLQNAGATANIQFWVSYNRFTPSATSGVQANRTITLGATGTFPTAISGGDLWIIGMPVGTLLIPGEAKIPFLLPESKEESGEDDDDDDEDYVKYLLAKRQKKLASLTSVPATPIAAAAAAALDAPVEALVPKGKATSKK